MHDLFVTTSFRGRKSLAGRAQVVASRIGVPFVPREKQSLELLRAELGRSLVYCVSCPREDVRGPLDRISIEESLIFLKLRAGRAHPFIRAVLGSDSRVESVLDASLGLLQDAIQLACVLGCRVSGLEASPVMYCLLEEGLVRLRRSGVWVRDAVPKISAHFGESARTLEALPAESFDVVCFDPMFEPPKGDQARAAVPGYSLFRRLAARPPIAPVLDQVLRVAKRRVVMKLPAGATAPEGVRWSRREEGKSISYIVAEKESSRP
ncbi:MAG: class I SAM-dependent methyltransferase [Deltaproteobacteria bacterium]|nr:class I SAM-dependent methyltransferase [Deltaproteobacteria bacterium]